MTVAIIGLGYVGLPLCLQFARSGVRVLGLGVAYKANVDDDREKKEKLQPPM